MVGNEAGRKIFSPRLGCLMEPGFRASSGESEVGHWGLPRWGNDLGEVPAFCPLDYIQL